MTADQPEMVEAATTPTTATATSTTTATTTRPTSSAGMTNRLGQKRKVGEPPFDKLIVGGTLSLGLLLLIGGIVILIISLVDRSGFNDASLNDFESLGDKACLIESSYSYNTINQELNKLNSICIEEWQYNVRVVIEIDDADDDEHNNNNKTFVSNTLSATACKNKCELCKKGDLLGENFYIGVENNKRVGSITKDTKVECWAPTFASRRGDDNNNNVEDLSDFYNCGNKEDSSSCYQLQDPSIPLKAAMTSNQLGMIAAWVGLIGGVIFVLVGGWFVWKNRRALQDDEKLLKEIEEDKEKEESFGDDDDDDEQKGIAKQQEDV